MPPSSPPVPPAFSGALPRRTAAPKAGPPCRHRPDEGRVTGSRRRGGCCEGGGAISLLPCVTIGEAVGRVLQATHGDGMLGPYGFASNTDWHMGSTETAGFGCRGDGYEEPHRPYGSLHPPSPRGDRKRAAWPGSARVNA